MIIGVAVLFNDGCQLSLDECYEMVLVFHCQILIAYNKILLLMLMIKTYLGISNLYD